MKIRHGQPAVDPGVSIGHVHLKVADLGRALTFYCGVMGFQLTQRMDDSAAFISAGGYHHHIGLNTWESLGGKSPARGTTGFYHVATLYPTRAALADALRRLVAAGIELDGASGNSLAPAQTSSCAGAKLLRYWGHFGTCGAGRLAAGCAIKIQGKP